jgi:hypothetical protein
MSVADVLLAHGFFGDRPEGEINFNKARVCVSVHCSKTSTSEALL